MYSSLTYPIAIRAALHLLTHRYQEDFLQHVEKDGLSIRALRTWHRELIHMVEKKQLLLRQHIDEGCQTLQNLYELYNIPVSQRIDLLAIQSANGSEEQVLAQLREEIRTLEQRKALHGRIQQLLQ
uniref:Uncharacterized protein n=1 Tax=Lygus hesperus TaxID=30085 RepID=A0A0A9W3P0_LYGHE